MKVSEALNLLQKAHDNANMYFNSMLQVNMLQPLATLAPDAELAQDFLSAADSITSNSNLRMTRQQLLHSVIRDIEKGGEHPALVQELKSFAEAYKLPPSVSPQSSCGL